MANIQPILRIEIDPTKPVQEICAVISAVTPYHAKEQEVLILQGVIDAIQKRITELKGAEADGKPIRESRRNEENQG